MPSYATGPPSFSFMSEAICCGKASGGFRRQSWKSSRWQIPNPTPLRKSQASAILFGNFRNCTCSRLLQWPLECIPFGSCQRSRVRPLHRRLIDTRCHTRDFSKHWPPRWAKRVNMASSLPSLLSNLDDLCKQIPSSNITIQWCGPLSVNNAIWRKPLPRLTYGTDVLHPHHY